MLIVFFLSALMISIFVLYHRKSKTISEVPPIDTKLSGNKKTSFYMKWKQWDSIRRDMRKVWLRGVHRYIYYSGIAFVLFGMILFFTIFYKTYREPIHVLLYFAFISILYIGELIRLAKIEYKKHRFIFSVISVVLLIAFYVYSAYAISEEEFIGLLILPFIIVLIITMIIDIINLNSTLPQ